MILTRISVAECALGAVRGLMGLFSLDVLRLNALLGLPALERTICHGYSCCCRCPECCDREKNGQRAKPAPRQPWEIEAA